MAFKLLKKKKKYDGKANGKKKKVNKGEKRLLYNTLNFDKKKKKKKATPIYISDDGLDKRYIIIDTAKQIINPLRAFFFFCLASYITFAMGQIVG